MAIAQAVANSFKQEILEGIHNFETGATGDVFKLALYTSDANLSAATTAYSVTNEVPNSGEYSAGGGTLQSQQTGLDTGVAIVDFSDLSFTGVTLTARGALIYNTSESNKAVCVLDFGSDKTATSGTFTIQFPAFTSSAAILRIA
jgi:hypothetical protein